jgi:hypothetical protein
MDPCLFQNEIGMLTMREKPVADVPFWQCDRMGQRGPTATARTLLNDTLILNDRGRSGDPGWGVSQEESQRNGQSPNGLTVGS